jgi:hypothetical protein
MPTAVEDDGVVVDIVFESGLLFLELCNLTGRPAIGVSSVFEPALTDGHGRDVSKLALFRAVDYIGPDRRIRTLLDTSVGYFGRKAPLRVKVTTRFKGPDGKARTAAVSHNLAIYRDLAYV